MTADARKRLWLLTAGTIAAFAALGCIPKRIVWSPDGQRAVVMTKSEVYITDVEGHLSEPWKEVALQAAWFHDSKRVAVLRKQTVKTWDEIKAYLSEERQKELLAMVDSQREEILAHKGNWKDWQPSRLKARELSAGELVALGFYIREHRNEGFEEKLGDRWNEWKEMTYDVSLIQVCEVSEKGIQAGAVVVKSLEDIGAGTITIAPHDRYLSYVATKYGEVGDLMLSEPTEDAASPLRVAEFVANYPSWSLDGQMLVYARTSPPSTAGDNEVRLGSISRRRVCSADGQRLTEFGTAEDLAGILFTPHTKVHCLADGRILFSAAETHLPSTSNDMPTRFNLFVIDPGRLPTLTRMITRQAEQNLPGDSLSFGLFEVSPDGSRVSIPEWDNGGVYVYALGAGELKEVLPSVKDGPDLPGVPSWRSSEELCITVPAGSKLGSEARTEVILWTEGTNETRMLSREWSDEIMQALLDK